MNDSLHTKWLDEALDQIPADLKADSDGTTHRDIVAEYLRPLLKRCRATTRTRFWTWLRQQLAKTEDSAYYLEWMQESRCPAEVAPQVNGSLEGFEYEVNGDVALIAVGDEQHPAVWKVPVAYLEWALSLYPVTLKRLPQLETPQLKEIRRIRRKLTKSPLPRFSAAQRLELLDEIAKLEAAATQNFDPAPRYCLVKSSDGRQQEVHRMFLNVDASCEVQAVNDDFLDFTFVPYRVTVTPVPTAGLAVGKYRRPPQIEIERGMIPNLQIVNSGEVQKGFDKSHLQVKTTPYGDIKTTLRVQPNAKWATGVCGHVADCGASEPITPEEATIAGLAGAEVRPVDEAAIIRRKWRVPTNVSGLRWG